MKNITLQRPIEVICYHVIGRIAKAKKRPELLPVLLRAREHRTTDAKDVAKHLLFEVHSREVVARRLLEIACAYDLLELKDRKYILTESGHTALSTEQVFVPEQGAWTIWISNDPLFKAPVLRVEPWNEPTAYDEVIGRDRDNNEKRNIIPLPQWIQSSYGILVKPLAGNDGQIRIEELDSKCEMVDSDVKLRAVWDVTTSRLRVEGSLGGDRVDSVQVAPDIDIEDVWHQLMESEGLWRYWDPTTASLRVDFKDTAQEERESMVRSIVFKRPYISGLDQFEATTVQGISLKAKSTSDAQAWASWRLENRIRDYATTERFSAWVDESIAPFKDFKLSPPPRKVLASDAWRERNNKPTQNTWHLIAAEDWSL